MNIAKINMSQYSEMDISKRVYFKLKFVYKITVYLLLFAVLLAA